MKKQLTQSRLRELFSYSPEDGLFRRLVSTNNRVKVGDVAGNVRSDGYVKVRVDFDMHYAHRLAWLYMTGEFPIQKIDHISGDKSDNRFANLRDVSAFTNNQNIQPRTNRSREPGVHSVNGKSPYTLIKSNGVLIRLGSYPSKLAASAAYLTAKLIVHPESSFAMGIRPNIKLLSPTAIKNLRFAGYLSATA